MQSFLFGRTGAQSLLAVGLTVAILGSVSVLVVDEATAHKSASFVVSEAQAGRFPLAVGGQPAPLHVSGDDFDGMVRTASNLHPDLARLTGSPPFALM